MNPENKLRERNQIQKDTYSNLPYSMCMETKGHVF